MNNTTIKNIALLTGGITAENKISIKSAATIEKNLDPDKFVVYTIMVTEESWYYQSQVFGNQQIDRNDFSLTINGIKIVFDGVFIAIHGAPGEDGKLQGYFDLLNIPYTSCDCLTSALTMNKSYTKSIVKDVKNLKIANSVHLFENNDYDLQKITTNLSLPYFVKPNNGGSSIGMSKVEKIDDLESAVRKAFEQDDQILIEEFVAGREFTVGVIKLDGKVIVLPITEIETKLGFFDFKAKYTPGMAIETTPAMLQDLTTQRVEQIVESLYKRLNCRGIIRIDFILTGADEDFYFLEINTIPGQTQTSFIPQQVEAMGITLTDFYTKLLNETIFTHQLV